MKISYLSLAAALVAAAPAFAQEAPDSGAADNRDIIVTGARVGGDFGGRSGIPIEQVPQSVQVITADDIVEQGARSIGDLLRDVPSANAGYSRVGAYQSFSLRVRGFLADQMRNGIRQRYYEDVDASALSNIERVEVLKGPSGVLFGQSAVGGIISIITRQPQQDAAGTMAITLGNDDQRMLSFDMTGGLSDDVAVRVTGEVERSGTFVDYQDLNRINGAFSLRYTPTDMISANLVAEYVERDTRRNPGLPISGTVVSNGVRPLSRGLFLGEPAIDDMQAHAPLVQAWVDIGLGHGWTVTPRFQFQEFNTRFYQIRVRSAQTDGVTINRNGRQGHENDAYYIAQIDAAGEIVTGPVTHNLLMGFEYDWERGRFTQSNLTNVTAINALNPVYTYATTLPTQTFAFDNFYNIDGQALYLQDQIAVTDRWSIIGAVRHSWIDAADGTYGGATANQAKTSNTIYQIGSTYRIVDGLSVYAGFNTGFDVESSAGARSANGQPLRPEESQQIEFGVRFNMAGVRGSIALFEIKRTNALTTDPLNPDFSINVGEQRVRGIEVEANWQPVEWWSLHAGYAYLDSEITSSNDGDQGLRIGDVPKHTVTARTQISIPGTGLELRGGVNYVSNRLLVNGSSTILPSYVLADVGGGYRFGRYSVDVVLANLFDETYYTASGNAFAVVPGDPRSLSVRFGVAF